MAKLYFKYGAMGSSKTAQALMCRFNYIQKGFNVFLFKPTVDKRHSDNGIPKVWSRIGLTSECIEFEKEDNFINLCKTYNISGQRDIIIIDECQFMTKEQVNQLKDISINIPVLCYGLLTNYKTELFEGSKRLVELADSLSEIKCICRCGRKATVNVRFIDGKVATEGEDIVIGGDEKYESMCYHCYIKAKNNTKAETIIDV